jgi:hypothetical protein
MKSAFLTDAQKKKKKPTLYDEEIWKKTGSAREEMPGSQRH